MPSNYDMTPMFEMTAYTTAKYDLLKRTLLVWKPISKRGAIVTFPKTQLPLLPQLWQQVTTTAERTGPFKIIPGVWLHNFLGSGLSADLVNRTFWANLVQSFNGFSSLNPQYIALNGTQTFSYYLSGQTTVDLQTLTQAVATLPSDKTYILNIGPLASDETILSRWIELIKAFYRSGRKIIILDRSKEDVNYNPHWSIRAKELLTSAAPLSVAMTENMFFSMITQPPTNGWAPDFILSEADSKPVIITHVNEDSWMNAATLITSSLSTNTIVQTKSLLGQFQERLTQTLEIWKNINAEIVGGEADPNGFGTQSQPEMLNWSTSTKTSLDNLATSTTEKITWINRILSNRSPIANSVSVTTEEGQSINISLLGTDTDNDSLVYKIQQLPVGSLYDNSTLVSNVGTVVSPSLIYMAPVGITSDTFTYTVNDGIMESSPASATISITPVALPPFPTADTQIDMCDANEQFIEKNKYYLPPRYGWERQMTQTIQMKLQYVTGETPQSAFDKTVLSMQTRKGMIQWGTYISGSNVIQKDSQIAYPISRINVEDLGVEFTSGPAMWEPNPPWPQYNVDLSLPAARAKFAQLILEEAVARKASSPTMTHLFMDNVGYDYPIGRPAVSNPDHNRKEDWIFDKRIMWADVAKFLKTVRDGLKVLKMKFIINLGWSWIGAGTKEDQDFTTLPNLCDGVALEMFVHQNFRTNPAAVRKLLSWWTQWLDAGKYMMGQPVINLHPTLGNKYESIFEAAALMMVWKPTHSGFISRNVFTDRPDWWNWPARSGNPLGPYQVLSESPLILKRDFQNGSITVNFNSTMWSNTEDPRSQDIIDRLASAVTVTF